MAPELRQNHVIIFPYMAQGHTIPLIGLCKALTKQGLRITIITTPSNAPSISQSISNYPLIKLIEIPFPIVTNLPKGVENTSQLPSFAYLVPFLQATRQLKGPFEGVLEEMEKSKDLPICVISDFFLGWTLRSCQVFGVPRLVFHGMGVLSMTITKSAWVHAATYGTIESSEPLLLQNINLPFALTGADLPFGVGSQEHDDPFNQLIVQDADDEMNSWGIVVNSFSELEGDYISSLEPFYQNDAKAWCVGPLSLYGDDQDTEEMTYQPSEIKMWLDKLQMIQKSAIYVSFGTQADVSDVQLDEVAYGLEASRLPFLWVVRSETWTLPKEIEEKIKDRGLIVRKWVDQRSILAHPTIGGFLSHCGWNSVLESISCGVPILTWPLIAEQILNALFLAEGLGAGIRVNKFIFSDLERSKGLVPREAVCEGVQELMKGRKGGVCREKAKALGQIARKATVEGGSSYNTLAHLIHELTHYKK